MPLVEENHIKTTGGESYDYAAVWWSGKAQKYQGIWCADINDEGCNGFEAKLEGNQVVMTGEWEQNGKRRAWREAFAPTSSTSVTQSLEIGEPGGELKRVSAINATKVREVPMIDAPAAESELRAVMAERRKAALEGDTEKVVSSMADEYVQTDINGYVQDKNTWLNEYFKPLAELIKAGKFRWEVYEQKDVQLGVFGDSAVAVGTLELKGSGARTTPQHTWMADAGASFSGRPRFTHVYIKRNGKWFLAAIHNAIPLPLGDK
jgi:ketosteroid isomerase-like protein